MNKSIQKRLGQYFTKNEISDVIFNLTKFNPDSKIIDLCAGDGSLIREFYYSSLNPKVTLCDIDVSNISLLKNEFTEANIFNIDTTDLEAIKNLPIKKYDIAVCNPPFLSVEINEEWDKIFNFKNMGYPSKINTEVFYLFLNLFLLKTNGILAIILPDSILTGQKHLHLRKGLFKNYTTMSITELHSKSFNNTEVKCHLVIIKKSKPYTNHVVISKLNQDNTIESPLSVSINELINRSDYSFYRNISRSSKSGITLSSIGASVQRGSLSRSEFSKRGIQAFHTTSFNKSTLERYCSNDNLGNLHTAKDGDILIARVGKRCLNKVKIINNLDNLIFTDCVYRIRVPKKHQELVWAAFSSEEMTDNLFAISKGVAARFLTKKDLLMSEIF